MNKYNSTIYYFVWTGGAKSEILIWKNLNWEKLKQNKLNIEKLDLEIFLGKLSYNLSK